MCHLSEWVTLLQGDGSSVGLWGGSVGPCVLGRGCQLLAGMVKNGAFQRPMLGLA